MEYPQAWRNSMIATSLYDKVRRTGNLVIFLSLSLSLVTNFADFGFIAAYLAACLLASKLGSIRDSINQFGRVYRQSDCGKTYTIFVTYTAISIVLALYHKDELRGVENPFIRLIVAYTIFYHLNNYTAKNVIYGSALGALLAGAIALYQFYVLDILRAGGVTNPIRFGMIAGLFSIISLAGFLFARQSRVFSILTLSGAIAGFVATVLSGSRGAVIAIPLMLLLLLLRLWYQSKRAAIAVLTVCVLIALSLGVFEAGKLRERTSNALEGVTAIWEGEKLKDVSVRDRVHMLELSAGLFRNHVLLGVGTRAWEKEIGRFTSSQDSEKVVSQIFNQAHNQFANDFAKGGVIMGLTGLALIFVPLVFFARSRPFGEGEESLAALVGLITSFGYAAFCLTESVMVLNLPSCIYAILICYLMAAKSKRSGHVVRSSARQDERI